VNPFNKKTNKPIALADPTVDEFAKKMNSLNLTFTFDFALAVIE
jgi:hypothetical protein